MWEFPFSASVRTSTLQSWTVTRRTLMTTSNLQNADSNPSQTAWLNYSYQPYYLTRHIDWTALQPTPERNNTCWYRPYSINICTWAGLGVCLMRVHVTTHFWAMESRLEKGPVCGVENCRSRWYEEAEDGYRYCQNGHQQFVCHMLTNTMGPCWCWVGSDSCCGRWWWLHPCNNH